MKNCDVRVYLGRFDDDEQPLFEVKNKNSRIPQKDEFIYFEEEIYKVLYIMTDIDHNELAIFVRRAVEEDY